MITTFSRSKCILDDLVIISDKADPYKKNNKSMPGANIYLEQQQKKTESNVEFRFSIKFRWKLIR